MLIGASAQAIQKRLNTSSGGYGYDGGGEAVSGRFRVTWDVNLLCEMEMGIRIELSGSENRKDGLFFASNVVTGD